MASSITFLFAALLAVVCLSILALLAVPASCYEDPAEAALTEDSRQNYTTRRQAWAAAGPMAARPGTGAPTVPAAMVSVLEVTSRTRSSTKMQTSVQCYKYCMH
jgi:hypothetical protein